MRKLWMWALVCVLVSVGQARAQAKKEFPMEAKAYAEELKKFFDDAKAEGPQAALKEFLELWNNASFAGSEQVNIMTMSNEMLKARMRPQQDFEAYLQILSAYKNNKVPEDKLNGFHKVLSELLSKNKKDYKDFATASLALFGKNAIYDNGVKSWTVSGQDYIFVFDKEAIIRFNNTDLIHYTKGDTMGIFKTKGSYHTNTNKWYGETGEVYWTRVGFPKDQAYARLKKYQLDTRNSDYTADSVTFSFPRALKAPVLGRLMDKATTSYQGVKADYPRFSSYQNIFELKNIFKGIDFKGAFTLEGQQIKGTGTDSSRAMITIKKGNKVVVRAFSKSFTIDPEKVVAAKAAVAIYLGKDSVYHSQAVFNYQDKARKLAISRKDEGVFASPFSDSYHQVDVYADNIFWNLDENEMTLRSISNSAKEVRIESSDYYHENRMVQIQGILTYNPIIKLARFFNSPNNTASLDEVAAHFGTEPRFIEEMLFMLAQEGFILFDPEGRKVTSKQKLIHHDAAYSRNEDYDVIKFESVISGKPNGTINLTTNEMELQGVNMIRLSDSQQTYIVPKDQVIKMKKNRDLVFEGQVHSGRFDFYGKGFYFDYDTFQFRLTNVDSVKFKFPEYDKDGKVIAMRDIQTTINSVTGKLEIDHPGNKSGRKEMKEYPIFTCTKESYVYYDKKAIYNAVYDRKRFFFKIDPFVISNLDKFTAKGLQFPGTFQSADILPVFKNALSIQEDFSLGFITESPKPKGWALYKGKGQANGIFNLSNKGLRAEAEVDYLVSKSQARNFTFFPDSMNSITNKFEIQEVAGGKYPPMLGKDVYNHWMPYKDSMYIYKREHPISVYKGKVNFEGSFVLTPQELVGNGTTKYQNLELRSQTFAFFADAIRTKKADLDLKSDASSKKALTATDINADIDLTTDFAKFKTNSDTSKVQLPSNLFATTLNKFSYDIKKKEVSFERTTAQKLEDAYFVSNNPVQENLNFTSSKATYNINDLNLKAQDVPYLLIGDAQIATPNKELTIQKEGVIGSIKGADIVCSEKLKYHKIYNALVNIFSKSKFTGYGDYDYVDKSGTKQRIHFSDIRTTEDLRTSAKGAIVDSSKFYIGPKIRYIGNVQLHSEEKDLYFDGFVKPEHNFQQLGTQWAKVSDTVDPKNMFFDLSVPVGQDNKELFTGTFVGEDSVGTYDLFLGKKRNPKDRPLITITGIFFYDQKTNTFNLQDRNKLFPASGADPLFIGANAFRLNPTKEELYTEGLYQFGTRFNELHLRTAGSYTSNLKDNRGEWEVAMIVDFPAHENTVKLMTDSVLALSYTQQEAKITDQATLNAFAMMMDDRKDRNKVINELNSYNYLASADAVNKVFTFTKVKLQYADSLNGFVSNGPIYLAAIKKTGINKQMTGVVKITNDPKHDELGILLESSPDGGYYFFDFLDNDATYLSSDMTWVDAVTATASKVSKGGFKLKQGTVEDASRLKFKLGN